MKLFKFIKYEYNYIPFLMLFAVPVLLRLDRQLSFAIAITVLIVYLIYCFLVTKVYLKNIKDKKQAIRTSMRDHLLLFIAIAINYLYEMFFVPEGFAEINFLIIFITCMCVLPKCLTCFKMHQNDENAG